MSSESNRAKGAVLGLAVGDALGTTLEFKRLPEAPWSPLLSGPHTEVTGEGPFGVLPGQVTDDTMMACCLATSLRMSGGLDLDDVARRYVDWRNVTFDCGGQTGSSLSNVSGGSSPEVSGRMTWERGGGHAAGNGSLMRTAPIGAFFAGDLVGIVHASVRDSNITHFDPRCSLACAAMNAAIGHAVSFGAERLAPIVEAAEKGLHLATGYFLGMYPDLSDKINDAFTALLGDLEAAKGEDPGLYSQELHIHTMQGFVRVAFRLAFWELMHASDYRSGLTDAVNRGGDADTNGAIVGSLLGAVYGEEGIPAEWMSVVLNCDPHAPFGATGPLHPNRLIEMVESL